MTEVIPLWLVNLLSFITIFSVMTSIGTTLTPEGFVENLRAPGTVLLGLFAVLVVVPLAGFATVLALGLTSQQKIGVALMAIAPGAPLALRRALGSGGHATYAPTLQILVAIGSIAAMPLWVGFGNWLFGTQGIVDLALIAKQVFVAQLLPLAVGAAVRRWSPGWGARLGVLLGRAGAVLLIVAVAMMSVNLHEHILEAPRWPMAAAAIITVVALAAGHLMGGRAHEIGHAIAIAAALRNFGLALLVASTNRILPAVQIVIISYGLAALAIVTVYVLLWGRLRDRSLAPAPGR